MSHSIESWSLSDPGEAKIIGITWDVVAERIRKSNRMKYKWAQKEDDIGHTSIVIQLDKTAKYSLDYGGEINQVTQAVKAGSLYSSDKSAGSSRHLPSSDRPAAASRELVRKSAGKMELSGFVALQHFDAENNQIKGTLLSLSLRTKPEKEDAVGLFYSLREIQIGKYILERNNCRTYVIAVAAELKEKALSQSSEDNWSEFEREINNVLEDDERKMLEFVQGRKSVDDFVKV